MFFFFKQKTAYEMRISDWSSDVCSSDLPEHALAPDLGPHRAHRAAHHVACHLAAAGLVEFPQIDNVVPHHGVNLARPQGGATGWSAMVRRRPNEDRKSTRLNSSH